MHLLFTLKFTPFGRIIRVKLQSGFPPGLRRFVTAALLVDDLHDEDEDAGEAGGQQRREQRDQLTASQSRTLRTAGIRKEVLPHPMTLIGTLGSVMVT